MKKEGPWCATGAGLFATQDQYRVIPGNGHEIIDRIRYLALSGLSAHRLADLKSIHAIVLFLQVSSILLDSLVLNIPRSVYQLFFLDSVRQSFPSVIIPVKISFSSALLQKI